MTIADKSNAIKEISKTLAHQLIYIQEYGQDMSYEDLVCLQEAANEITKEMVEMWKKNIAASKVPCQC